MKEGIIQGDCQEAREGNATPVNYGGLPLFLGVKIIGAEPMDMNTFNRTFKGMDVEENSENAPGYKVVYEDGYTSWSPKYAFDKAYRKTDGLNFGLAIEALKMHKKVARKGWNGKGMYLKLQQGYPVNGHLNATSQFGDSIQGNPKMYDIPENCPDGSPNITQGKPGQMLSHILMKVAGDSESWGEGCSDYVPWLASQTDILADDYFIIE